ncbi:MAG: hypothetical protein ABJE87_07295, partial [Roseobacter sp.]
MALSRKHLVASAFIFAGGASLLAANHSVQLIEDNSEIEIRNALDQNDLHWAEVEADGLRVILA